jgi:pimeloyl-ACP methyl ester carboxylesterase
VGPPGSFGVMTTPDAEPGMKALVPPETNWENRVSARITLHVAPYRPGRAAAKLRCPVLFCLCDNDSLTPAPTSAKHAARAPRAEIKRYPVGHFEIYVDPTWSEAVRDQTDFLVRTLGPGATRPAQQATTA